MRLSRILLSIPRVTVLTLVCTLVTILVGSVGVFVLSARQELLIVENSLLLSWYTTLGFGLLFMSVPCAFLSLILSVVMCSLPGGMKRRSGIVLSVASALGALFPLIFFGLTLSDSSLHKEDLLFIVISVALFVVPAVFGALAALLCERVLARRRSASLFGKA